MIDFPRWYKLDEYTDNKMTHVYHKALLHIDVVYSLW